MTVLSHSSDGDTSTLPLLRYCSHLFCFKVIFVVLATLSFTTAVGLVFIKKIKMHILLILKFYLKMTCHQDCGKTDKNFILDSDAAA